jgi:hypothetical protein
VAIKIDDIANEIAKQVELYTEDVKKKIKSAENKIAKESVEELKAKSPKGATGEYAQSWDKKRTKDGIVVYNKTSLTHLLEYGHAKKNGGRVQGQPHIRPVEEKAVEQFTELVEKAIKQ